MQLPKGSAGVGSAPGVSACKWTIAMVSHDATWHSSFDVLQLCNYASTCMQKSPVYNMMTCCL